jgi:hypothetical protein
MSGNTGIAYITIDNKRGYVYDNRVTPGFFELFKIPMVAGRTFTDADTASSEPVVILNEVLARRIRADGNLVGQRIAIGAADASAKTPDEQRLVVGITANMRNNGGDLRSRSEAWVPYAQTPGFALTIVADAEPGRDADAAAAIRSAVRALRPNLVMNEIRTAQNNLDRGMVYSRLGAWLLGTFAALAVALAAAGLLTTMSWWVGQRTREMGVRMALGATQSQLNGLVLRQGLLIATSGIGVGCGIAASVTRYMTSWIYGVTPLDPLTFAGAGALMLFVAAIAIFFPTRRASRVDPVTALRAE